MVLVMALTGHKRPVRSNESTDIDPRSQHRPRECRQSHTTFRKPLNKRNANPHRRLRKHCFNDRGNWQRRGWDRPSPFHRRPMEPRSPLLIPTARTRPVLTRPALLSLRRGQTDTIKDEQKKRAYMSLFSDNVALTYRKELRTPEAGRTRLFCPPQDHARSQASAELARGQEILAQAQKAGFLPAAGQ